MNTYLVRVSHLLGAGLLMPAMSQAADRPPAVESKTEMRVMAVPAERERRVIVRHGEPGGGEMEKVAFLGVEAGPVSPTLGAQLALPRGTGLVVSHVVPKSPAAGVLAEHDILLKVDDQILIETRQLSVLIRNHQEGDEVLLTYLRAGQKATAKVKLGQHEVPKLGAMEGNAVIRAFGFSHGAPGSPEAHGAGPAGEREQVDQLLSMLRRGEGGGVSAPVRIQVEPQGGPGFRATSVKVNTSKIVFTDDQGSLELSSKEGVKRLTAKNQQGETVFAGPVTTPEDRKAMPPELRSRLEKLEGMHDISFRTDGAFKGSEVREVRPRGI
jgi:hypothetical protein